ncbi:MAG: hypothetical protein JST55_13245 [Bacteroidetes bacterium]|nr:hypothetical protein [Bacteroidota bacterium]
MSKALANALALMLIMFIVWVYKRHIKFNKAKLKKMFDKGQYVRIIDKYAVNTSKLPSDLILDKEVYLIFAKCYFETGKLRDSLLELDASLRINSYYQEAYLLKIKILKLLGDFSRATSTVKELIELYPDQQEYKNLLN